MRCPYCKSANRRQSKLTQEFSINYCNDCERLFKFDRKSETVIPLGVVEYEPVSEQIPDFGIASRVYLNDKQHKLFLEQGIVTKLSHLYVRVKFLSTDEKIDGVQLWLPYHVLKLLPVELWVNES